jgi:hypothetical protein
MSMNLNGSSGMLMVMAGWFSRDLEVDDDVATDDGPPWQVKCNQRLSALAIQPQCKG